MDTKNNIFKRYRTEYLKAIKKRKTEIISHVKDVTGMNRKSIIRRFRKKQKKESLRTIKGGRPSYYTNDVNAALRSVFDASGEICAERLHGVVGMYVTNLRKNRHWLHGDEITGKLLAMSLGTTKNRILHFKKSKYKGKGRSTTKPSQLRMLIPIRTGPWKDPDAGYGEIDTVEHGGSSPAGHYAYTVNYIDIATFWEVRRAQLGKGQERTLDNIKVIKNRLPFQLRGLDPDSGGEFINWNCYNWCTKEGVELSRSRPYRKNDNAHIEQRNDTGVRKVIGYLRIDCKEAVDVLNELYETLDGYSNFFIPSLRLVSKERIGSQYKRKYEKDAKTPYQRALERDDIKKTIKDKLTEKFNSLDVLELKNRVDKLVTKLYKTQEKYGKHENLIQD